MLVYRIVHKSYSKELTASGLKGRWNSSGKKVIYASDSIATAFLESMVRRQGVGFNKDFKIMVIKLPSTIKISFVEANNLTDGWKDFHDYSQCQAIGDAWYNDGATPVLKVPSVIIPGSFNYVINFNHKEFKKITLLEVTDLVPDDRIEDILKRYPNDS
jgi:RES domain-containing protein